MVPEGDKIRVFMPTPRRAWFFLDNGPSPHGAYEFHEDWIAIGVMLILLGLTLVGVGSFLDYWNQFSTVGGGATWRVEPISLGLGIGAVLFGFAQLPRRRLVQLESGRRATIILRSFFCSSEREILWRSLGLEIRSVVGLRRLGRRLGLVEVVLIRWDDGFFVVAMHPDERRIEQYATALSQRTALPLTRPREVLVACL